MRRTGGMRCARRSACEPATPLFFQQGCGTVGIRDCAQYSIDRHCSSSTAANKRIMASGGDTAVTTQPRSKRKEVEQFVSDLDPTQVVGEWIHRIILWLQLLKFSFLCTAFCSLRLKYCNWKYYATIPIPLNHTSSWMQGRFWLCRNWGTPPFSINTIKFTYVHHKIIIIRSSLTMVHIEIEMKLVSVQIMQSGLLKMLLTSTWSPLTWSTWLKHSWRITSLVLYFLRLR